MSLVLTDVPTNDYYLYKVVLYSDLLKQYMVTEILNVKAQGFFQTEVGTRNGTTILCRAVSAVATFPPNVLSFN